MYSNLDSRSSSELDSKLQKGGIQKTEEDETDGEFDFKENPF